jgi:protein subunit release factor B
MASFISRKKEEALKAKMDSLRIIESDLEEMFMRSGKKGGQNVNKTSTCVYLRHRPSGIEIKCQSERSQVLNRFIARRALADKIEALISDRESEARNKIEKIRRQKRRRSRRAKEKILGDKKIRSKKKALRRAPVEE